MKKTIFLTALMGLMGFANADQTLGESARATGNDAQRALQKGSNRVEEKVCMKGDAKCLAEKAANRAQETGSAVSDKASETVDKVD